MIGSQTSTKGAIPFGVHMASSAHFDSLFKDGMALVEETAAYLDGEGRAESRRLPRSGALSYAAESMRLTTRLMQIASWLLLQRAVNEGEITQADAIKDRGRAAMDDLPASTLDPSLPTNLVVLIEKAFDLQTRIGRLDALLQTTNEQVSVAEHPLQAQMQRLHSAFGPGIR